jgi:hypothetical protein
MIAKQQELHALQLVDSAHFSTFTFPLSSAAAAAQTCQLIFLPSSV